MKGLAQRLDALTLPSIPKAFNDAEATQILSILRNAQARVRPYDGDYSPPWLLSAFDSPLWHTTNRGREEHVQGRWRNTVDIDWNQLLPNGARLVDPEYALLLSTLKKMCVLLRSGYVGWGLAPGNWRLATAQLLLVARWLVLHEARYQPARHAFALLDQNALNLLLRQISLGSWIEALQIPQRLLSAWYPHAFGESCPRTFLDNPYTLPSEVCGTLTLWLTSQSCYVTRRGGVHHGLHNLDRARLALQVNTSTGFLTGSNWVRVFCRQFEPDFRHSPLLLSACMHTEYPDQTTPARQDTARSTASFGTLEQVAVTLGRILGGHRHLADAIPSPEELSVKKAVDLAKAHTRVHSYGEAIVDYYLATISHLDFSTLNTLSKQCKKAAVGKAFASVQRTAFLVEHHGRTQPLADALGIQTFNRGNGKAKFEALRQAPTLVETLDVLIGACIICIALLKPSREAELTHLTRECLTRRHGGYYLSFDLGKSNAGEAYQTRDKPIPVITAHAIRLLQRLGETLSKAFGETRKRKDSLFYLPCACLGIAINPHSKMLGNSLDRFCDYVGLPPDTEGRRWYVRVHEMRKWFLLLLFWAGRFDVLDAVRWIAGHVDVAHTYAYIEQQFPGEELPGIEAEYSIDRLRRWDRAKRETDSAACLVDEPGLEALYDRVCRYFNVASLVMIPEPQWTDYVTALRAEGGFSLYPQSIYGKDGDHRVGLQVSFVLAQNTA
jgi:hypothetical protein